MKGSLGTELCCLLGPDGGTGIFGGKKAAPFRDRAAGTTGFILRKSRTAKAPPRDDATRKIKSSIAAPRILAPSITAKQIELRASRDRDYILLQKRNRRVGWKVRIA